MYDGADDAADISASTTPPRRTSVSTPPARGHHRQHDVHQEEVDIVAAEMGIAVGREDLEDAGLDLQDRDIQRAAAQVVDGDDAGAPLVEAVGERRRGRLVDDPQDLE